MKNGGVFVSIALLVTITLVMGVIFVNGWTDAPNAIATAVSTRVLKPNVAIWMAVRFFQLWFGQLLRGILVFPQVKAMR